MKASTEGFDIPDGIGEMLPYAGEVILGIRLVMDIVSTERDFKDVQLQDRSRVHALKALVLMSKFGVTTVFTTAGGAGGTAAGTALLPGVGLSGRRYRRQHWRSSFSRGPEPSLAAANDGGRHGSRRRGRYVLSQKQTGN